ncbi:MAG: aminopeptidase P family protein [Thermotogae bacterium]|nr:aminopeptidase P family protein [Thermotogota bacterium]
MVLEKVRQKMQEKALDLFLIYNREGSNPNLFYVTGFSGGDGVALIGKDTALLLVDSRYYVQARKELFPDIAMVELGKKKHWEAIKEIINDIKPRGIAFEGNRLSYRDYERLKDISDGADLVIGDDIIADMRKDKTEEEIDKIKVAIKVAQDAFNEMLNYVKVGTKERELAAILEFEMRKRGAECPSFDTIVASGWRGALPHGMASDKIIEDGDLIVIDFGARVDNYDSDLTRTIGVGNVSDNAKEIYEIVRVAQQTAREAAKAGIPAKELDAVARNIIDDAGYGRNFGHSLGHGVGLEVHEEPIVSASNENVLPPGCVVTIEPGIYIEGKFGVRIEDDVLLTEDGSECLSSLPRDLMIF